jgi:hypothetical protein
MECRASLIYAHLVSSGLDPDEIRQGQLLAVMAGLCALMLTHVLLSAA